MRLSFMVKYVLYFSCEKNENKQKEAGFGPFKGHQLPNDLEPLPLLKGKWSSQAQWRKSSINFAHLSILPIPITPFGRVTIYLKKFHLKASR